MGDALGTGLGVGLGVGLAPGLGVVSGIGVVSWAGLASEAESLPVRTATSKSSGFWPPAKTSIRSLVPVVSVTSI
ncbi:hypothetical protein COW20_13245 [bacterium (Candidatus Blackallbacteria) CG13_big_fil_rev_8_21_14_2_50_49_14]|nr:MAG: hypothetical protein COW20_13245 [bacterium (Candidatus Blackallbacteria) CG13_big_fil_rev_8_21_14_2_50_49_14]